jgi:hypothetical protein
MPQIRENDRLKLAEKKATATHTEERVIRVKGSMINITNRVDNQHPHLLQVAPPGEIPIIITTIITYHSTVRLVLVAPQYPRRLRLPCWTVLPLMTSLLLL